MAKEKTKYVCKECGGETSRWLGQCPHCAAWNSISEFKEFRPSKGTARSTWAGEAGKAVPLKDVPVETHVRYSTGLPELNRVLGGGLVKDSVILLGGDPGIGKSTLLLQVSSHIAAGHKVLYVSGEESVSQVNQRAQRLGLPCENVYILPEVAIESIIPVIAEEKPQLVIIDSIQAVYSQALESAPGTVSQIRDCAAQFTRIAKAQGVAFILIGHVTKEGALAGPRVLEHIVDTVLYFEGDPQAGFRLLRANKNRYGPANELGVFAMTETGLTEIDNPSALFLQEHETPVPGVAILATVEGNQPLLVEVQSLMEDSVSPMTRKLSVGFDQERTSLLMAVLTERCGISCAQKNVYLNAVGGVKIKETAADLALALACYSFIRKKPIPADVVVFGEVGLAGELRGVTNPQARINEARRLGFKQVIMPKHKGEALKTEGMVVHEFKTLSDAIAFLRKLD